MQPSTDADTYGSVQILEQVMSKTVDPTTALGVGQLADVMEMMITDMHLRKVTGEFWVNTLAQCRRVIELCAEISSLALLVNRLDIDDKTKATLKSMCELSINETSEIRKELTPKVNLLTQMPSPWATKH